MSPVYHAVTRWFIRRRGTATLDYPNAHIRVHATTTEVLHLRLRPLAKEPWTVEWIEEHLRPGDVLYDIGANIGVYTLIAAAKARGSATVVAIEPGYANFGGLCDNLLLNGMTDGVIPLPTLLGERTRLGSLAYRDTSAGAAIHVLDGNEGAYTQPMLVYALDDLLDQFDLPAPTLIKLDVDGAEGLVLAGASKTLRRPELRSLVVEVETDQTEAVLGALESAGFSLARRIDERYGEPLPDVWYGIFERPE